MREHEELGGGGVVPDMRCVRGDEVVHLVQAKSAVRLEHLSRGFGGLITQRNGAQGSGGEWWEKRSASGSVSPTICVMRSWMRSVKVVSAAGGSLPAHLAYASALLMRHLVSHTAVRSQPRRKHARRQLHLHPSNVPPLRSPGARLSHALRSC